MNRDKSHIYRHRGWDYHPARNWRRAYERDMKKIELETKTYVIRRTPENKTMKSAEAAKPIAEFIGAERSRMGRHLDVLLSGVRITVGPDAVILYNWHGNPPPEEI